LLEDCGEGYRRAGSRRRQIKPGRGARRTSAGRPHRGAQCACSDGERLRTGAPMVCDLGIHQYYHGSPKRGVDNKIDTAGRNDTTRPVRLMHTHMEPLGWRA
jgi:hypothetical protein